MPGPLSIIWPENGQLLPILFVLIGGSGGGNTRSLLREHSSDRNINLLEMVYCPADLGACSV
jgi:hypothetical protein